MENHGEITISILLCVLNSDPLLLFKDLEQIPYVGSNEFVDMLYNDEQLEDWCEDNKKSTSLFVDGLQSDNATHATSLVSSLSAKILKHEQLQKASAYVLGYFCGLRLEYNPKDPEEWLRKMMRSLIGQLLKTCENKGFGLDLSFLTFNDLPAIRTWDLQLLCRTFEILCFQLPAVSTLYCVFDYASACENEYFLKTLLQLVHHNAMKATVKMLFTSPGGNTVLRVAESELGVKIDKELYSRP
ncbi:hypothetical protein CC80DRAFT_592634 [Byssothecium circinans]|uniref:Nephrocystin 3-like N-terminal domain-containing protein n=1 Tax=Byssothecium circinans TaxID=147558 RepID=A0A6A5TYE0_9PLEO|nr:hypothetical protein CC80DRAFT_592634 [Byssothecium circinans]